MPDSGDESDTQSAAGNPGVQSPAGSFEIDPHKDPVIAALLGSQHSLAADAAAAAVGLSGGLIGGGLAATAEAAGSFDSVLGALEGDDSGDGGAAPKNSVAQQGLARAGGSTQRRLLSVNSWKGQEPGLFSLPARSGVRPELSVR